MRNTYTIRIQSGKRSKKVLYKRPENYGHDPKRDQRTFFVRVPYSSIGKIIENKIIGEIVHVKEKIIQKEKSVNGVMG